MNQNINQKNRRNIMSQTNSVPEANAHLKSGGLIIVDNCPLCGKRHSHSGYAKNNGEHRLADCGKGNYSLKIKGA